jgi:hypothetical protein
MATLPAFLKDRLHADPLFARAICIGAEITVEGYTKCSWPNTPDGQTIAALRRYEEQHAANPRAD